MLKSLRASKEKLVDTCGSIYSRMIYLKKFTLRWIKSVLILRCLSLEKHLFMVTDASLLNLSGQG